MYAVCAVLIVQRSWYHGISDWAQVAVTGLPIVVMHKDHNPIVSYLLDKTALQVSPDHCQRLCGVFRSGSRHECKTIHMTLQQKRQKLRNLTKSWFDCTSYAFDNITVIDRKKSRRFIPPPQKAVYLENMSPHHQVCFALNAKRVIGVHGAGLGLFAFLAGDDAHLLELCPYGYAACGFFANFTQNWDFALLPREASRRHPTCQAKCHVTNHSEDWWTTALKMWPSYDCRFAARDCVDILISKIPESTYTDFLGIDGRNLMR